MRDLSGYHPAVAEKLQWFTYEHLSIELAGVSKPFADLAFELADSLSGAQLTIGLQHLLDAKDCAVRARKAMD